MDYMALHFPETITQLVKLVHRLYCEHFSRNYFCCVLSTRRKNAIWFHYIRDRAEISVSKIMMDMQHYR